jgi:hypothetical protein
MTARLRVADPVHKVRVYRDHIGMWCADCQTCPRPLQHHVTGWYNHWSWKDALDTALRHNTTNKWMRT